MITSGAEWEPVGSHSGQMLSHRGLVLHVQAGNGDPFGWFSDPGNQASSTWWVGKDGRFVQYVDSELMAWAQAVGNATWNSVETEGYPTEPLTPYQIASLARLYAWGMSAYGWPLSLSESPSAPGFGWHGMGGIAWGNHPGCPGDIRKAQRLSILTLAQAPKIQGVGMFGDLASSRADNFNATVRYLWAMFRSDTLTGDALGYLNAVQNNANGSFDAVLACIIDTAVTHQPHSTLRPMWVGAA